MSTTPNTDPTPEPGDHLVITFDEDNGGYYVGWYDVNSYPPDLSIDKVQIDWGYLPRDIDRPPTEDELVSAGLQVMAEHLGVTGLGCSVADDVYVSRGD